MSRPAQNLLDEALGIGDDTFLVGGEGKVGRVLLIEDCVETSGAFILHHLIKRALPPHRPSGLVIFLSFAHPFSHYDRILRKMGSNLVMQRDRRSFLYRDLLSIKKTGAEEGEEMLLDLYGEVQKMVEACLLTGGSKDITIMIDDISLLEVAAHGESNLVLDFIHTATASRHNLVLPWLFLIMRIYIQAQKGLSYSTWNTFQILS